MYIDDVVLVVVVFFFFFFKQKTAYEMLRSLVGSFQRLASRALFRALRK